VLACPWLSSSQCPIPNRHLFYKSSDPKESRTIYTIDYCPSTDPKKLQGIVLKHIKTLPQYIHNRPIAYHTQIAFDILRHQLRQHLNDATTCSDDWFLRTRSIVLDSGCGTGRSTIVLGQKYPNSIVIGVDRSLLRLTKNRNVKKEYIPIEYSDGKMNYFMDKTQQPRVKRIHEDSMDEEEDVFNDDDDPTRLVEQVAPNVWLVRAELVDFWRLMIQHQWCVQHHYILYPNPYPKLTRVQQRWYAHPSFPLLFQLFASATSTDADKPQTMTVRSNWHQYLIEFADCARCALTAGGVHSGQRMNVGAVTKMVPPASGDEMKRQALTNFEEKYWLVNEPTYELVLQG
jgi:tRNA G46 methylase TrmB